MRKWFSVAVLLLFCTQLHAQDLGYTRKMLDTLTSKTFWGRGYTNNGMAKAAAFIAKELAAQGLKPMSGIQFNQDFEFPVNTFPGKMDVKINGKMLRPGIDFIIDPASVKAKGSGQLQKKDSLSFVSAGLRTTVLLKDKLTWSPAQTVNESTQLILNRKTFTGQPESIEIDVENRFETNFRASNVCAVVKGTKNPDSIIILTAHYDHLGGMGKDTYFPGANDNASGVSFLLSMAKYYAAHPQKYSIGFIFFAAEEAGLVGSEYFVDNPLIKLSSIKFLINMDLVGTGEAGMTVVNASVYPKEFKLLNEINDRDHLISKINSRGKAANSDHYFFTENGVPAFFIYTQGGISAYHDVYDAAKTLSFTVYNNLFKLVDGFVGAIGK